MYIFVLFLLFFPLEQRLDFKSRLFCSRRAQRATEPEPKSQNEFFSVFFYWRSGGVCFDG